MNNGVPPKVCKVQRQKGLGLSNAAPLRRTACTTGCRSCQRKREHVTLCKADAQHLRTVSSLMWRPLRIGQRTDAADRRGFLNFHVELRRPLLFVVRYSFNHRITLSLSTEQCAPLRAEMETTHHGSSSWTADDERFMRAALLQVVLQRRCLRPAHRRPRRRHFTASGCRCGR